ncbi:SDR family NAD(P)-dependent oxidoreductase [Streptomyces sp. NPDC004658]|uniref:SDR family NAD(P)-dependent oxidoreductase n=1 Tax=Streptomyces sp. NPDC004658 TaxID=3154672 RepID=UPI0033A3B2E5
MAAGAPSGIGPATARRLAELGAAAAVVTRRQDNFSALAADIASAGGKALYLPSTSSGSTTGSGRSISTSRE